jgi:hypothetical protein
MQVMLGVLSVEDATRSFVSAIPFDEAAVLAGSRKKISELENGATRAPWSTAAPAASDGYSVVGAEGTAESSGETFLCMSDIHRSEASVAEYSIDHGSWEATDSKWNGFVQIALHFHGMRVAQTLVHVCGPFSSPLLPAHVSPGLALHAPAHLEYFVQSCDTLLEKAIIRQCLLQRNALQRLAGHSNGSHVVSSTIRLW